MIWTILLVTTGVFGTLIAARHWWGWWVGFTNEMLWFAYAIYINDTPLKIMALVWGAANLRNAVVTRADQRS